MAQDMNDMRVELWRIAEKAGVTVGDFGRIWTRIVEAGNSHG